MADLFQWPATSVSSNRTAFRTFVRLIWFYKFIQIASPQLKLENRSIYCVSHLAGGKRAEFDWHFSGTKSSVGLRFQAIAKCAPRDRAKTLGRNDSRPIPTLGSRNARAVQPVGDCVCGCPDTVMMRRFNVRDRRSGLWSDHKGTTRRVLCHQARCG
jgi:hypothetical protein